MNGVLDGLLEAILIISEAISLLLTAPSTVSDVVFRNGREK